MAQVLSAIWLAARGWQVTAFDHSEVALERARAADPDGAVAWRLTDMHEAAPVVGAYDLVAALHLHIPPDARPAFFAGLAAAARPGGTLVVVAHHPSDPGGRPPTPDLYFTADEVAGYLPAAGRRSRPARGSCTRSTWSWWRDGRVAQAATGRRQPKAGASPGPTPAGRDRDAPRRGY